ncbi:SANT/Myb_domain [Hexamita inflata]|uniref:SANT/Myb domain n=1 Tax=Hexamita inflata TaxID=28002 RepID=A0AA86U1T4_9EUKA|nr:SANT/Myb domain [Hexamita inflata]CAI9936911.1 SANT/Myb domain [Hexamita inflata]
MTNRWQVGEIERFDKLFLEHGKNFKSIARHFNSRSYAQVRSHYYNLQYKNRPVARCGITMLENQSCDSIELGTMTKVSCTKSEISKSEEQERLFFYPFEEI